MELITLSNGLRIFLNPCENLRSAVVGVWVLSGSMYEKKEQNGISHFIEHIVFKGSKTRSGFEIAEGMDEIGATSNAYTTKQFTFFHVRALDYQIMKATDILFDMIKNPRLDENDIETEKGVVIEEIAMCEDDPGDVCFELHESSVFSGTTMAQEILGSRETVSSLTADDIRAYMADMYLPERTVIGISGSFDREEFLSKVEEYFGKDESRGREGEFYEIPFTPGYYLKEMPTEQNHIFLSFPGVASGSDEIYTLFLASFILGDSSSSLLNQRIREQLGLVYSISSWGQSHGGGGYIVVSMSLGEANEEKAITESIKIIGSFTEDITQRQLDIAKEKVISSIIMGGENPQARFSSNGRNQLLLSRFTTDDEIIDTIREISLERVREVCNKYLDLSQMAFTAVGKVKTEEEYRKIISEAVKRR